MLAQQKHIFMNEAIIELEAEQNSRSSSLTIADGLFLMIGLAAIIMRISGVGNVPLSSDEAVQAWGVWAYGQPGLDVLLSGSPAYFTLSRLLTPVLGFSDDTMRLVPALFGVGIVLLPWLWQRRLGTVGALTMSILLTVSPIQTIISRTAGGDATAVFSLLLLLIAIDTYQETSDNRWLYTGAATFGMGLASAPIFYGGVVTLAIAWGIHQLIGLPLFSHEGLIKPERDVGKTAVYTLIGTFIGVGTLFLWHPAGLGMAAEQFGGWFNLFSSGNNIVTLTEPLLAIARYEPILLTVGLVVILWATWRSRPFASFCVYWVAGILLLILGQRGAMENAALLTIPGIIMVSLFANVVLQKWQGRIGWLIASGTFLLLMLSLVNLARYARRFPYEPQELGNIWMIVTAVAFGLTFLYFILSQNAQLAYQGFLLGLLAFFIFFSWGTAWQLGHFSANDPRERWVTTGTDDDVQVLIPAIEEISNQVSNSVHDLDIFSGVDSPVLRWYLRDFRQAQFSDTLPVGTANELIISPFNTDLALGSDYMGSDYGLIRFEPAATNLAEQIPAPTPGMDLLRWWFFQESDNIVPEERIILWLRADTIQE